MSSDFLDSVTVMKLGDALSIEHGYQNYSDVWEALSQNKCVEIFASQQEQLYRDFPFSRLMDLCINRVVRRFHVSNGK